MKRTSKIGITILVFVLMVGFAVVTTNHIINSQSNVGINTDDFDIYFTEAKIDRDGTATIDSSNKRIITFNTKQLSMVGDSTTLDYTVCNNSSQYDANVNIQVSYDLVVDDIDYSSYLSFEYEGFDPTTSEHTTFMKGKSYKSGKVIITLIKPLLQEVQASITVTLVPSAAERTSAATFGYPDGTSLYLGDLYSTTGVKQKGTYGVAFFDPTDLTKDCYESNSTSTSGTKSGCMKWYIYNEDENNYTMILDHNTTAETIWCTKEDFIEAGGIESEWKYGNPSKGPVTANKQLIADTTDWNVSSRMITVDELVVLSNYSTWDHIHWFYFDGYGNYHQYSDSHTVGASSYAWLFDYTYDVYGSYGNTCINSGCNYNDPSVPGYWTASPSGEYFNCAYSVALNGIDSRLLNGGWEKFGIRPVVTVPKSIFE